MSRILDEVLDDNKRGHSKTATQEFRTDEKAAGTDAPAAVLTPTL
jgi:hypothetical protein